MNMFILVVMVINFRINFLSGYLYDLVKICRMLVYIIFMMSLVRKDNIKNVEMFGRK